MINITQLALPAQKFLQNNATTLLTGVGVTGTVATAVLAGKGGYKAALIIDTERQARKPSPGEDISGEDRTITHQDKVKLVWPEFIPAIGVGTVTIASILFAHKMNAGRAATLAAAYSLSENKLNEFRAKVTEKLGPEETADLEKKEVVVPNMPVFVEGDVLFLDTLTGRYFRSTLYTVQQAELTTNREIMKHGYASAGLFYSEIDMDDSEILEDLGWDSLYLVNLNLTPAINAEGKLYIVMDHLSKPKPDFSRD